MKKKKKAASKRKKHYVKVMWATNRRGGTSKVLKGDVKGAAVRAVARAMPGVRGTSGYNTAGWYSISFFRPGAMSGQTSMTFTGTEKKMRDLAAKLRATVKGIKATRFSE